MKNTLLIIIIAGMTTFFSCGPSAKEKALQTKLDSIAKQDSISKTEKNSGDKYLGTWKNAKYNWTITVTKAGETAYNIKLRCFANGTITATYSDGNLVRGGAVELSYSNGIVIYDGKEYEKVK